MSRTILSTKVNILNKIPCDLEIYMIKSKKNIGGNYNERY